MKSAKIQTLGFVLHFANSNILVHQQMQLDKYLPAGTINVEEYGNMEYRINQNMAHNDVLLNPSKQYIVPLHDCHSSFENQGGSMSKEIALVKKGRNK